LRCAQFLFAFLEDLKFEQINKLKKWLHGQIGVQDCFWGMALGDGLAAIPQTPKPVEPPVSKDGPLGPSGVWGVSPN